MLHELLLSLMGKPGSIIRQSQEGYFMDSSTQIATQPEAALFNELVKPGYYYSIISQFVNHQMLETSYLPPSETSIYRKAMAGGLKKALNEYQELILSIQHDFLKNRYFTFGNIKAQLTQHHQVLKQLSRIVKKIVEGKYRGGIIIDIIYEQFLAGSQWLKNPLGMVLKECQRVFMNQIIAWMLYGQIVDNGGQFFIHKVLHEKEEKARFGKQTDHYQISGWNWFTIEEQLIPKSLINSQNASKILFIGKSVKILKGLEKISVIPSKMILEDIKNMFEGDFNKIIFESVIQKIRHSIAQEMIQLIIGEQNLLKELEKINDYFLMFKGIFYHHFLEEAKNAGIEQIAQKERVQKKINDTCLQNTFMRFGNIQDAKRVYFQMKSLGFVFHGFKNFTNLCPIGNIDLIQGKLIKFSSLGGAIWHRTKQVVDNSFTIILNVCFKKTKHMFKTTRNDDYQSKQNIISLVIQNTRDISPSFHQNLPTLECIPEYVAINIGYDYSEEQQNYYSFIQVSAKSQRKIKQIEIQKHIPKKLNFLDEAVHQIKISHVNDELRVYLNSSNPYDSSQQNLMKIDSMRLSTHLGLEMGRANIGLISGIKSPDCLVEVQQWEMMCRPTNHYGDHWSDLSLNLKMNWPINLILTQDIMEVFGRIHKFLFPIRQVQIQLESLWTKIPKKMKQQRSREGLHSSEQRYLIIFERRLTSTRSRMVMTITNLWSYLLEDVAQTVWAKLKESLSSADDFQQVIGMINKYARTIQVMYFFNSNKIQRMIFQIIRCCKAFSSFFNRIISEFIDESTFKEHDNIDDMFSKNVQDFHYLMKQLSKTNNSTHLFHLTQRMEASTFKNRDKYY